MESVLLAKTRWVVDLHWWEAAVHFQNGSWKLQTGSVPWRSRQTNANETSLHGSPDHTYPFIPGVSRTQVSHWTIIGCQTVGTFLLQQTDLKTVFYSFTFSV